jgi:hypothetical protein
MKTRFVAHWFLGGGSGHDAMRGAELADLVSFVRDRMAKTVASSGGSTICVADLTSRATNPWIWKMESGGAVFAAGKFGKLFADLITN